ncbi:MAG: hypothetical protein KA354_01445 [Phycisphaerae bacterium]|nr:hypothetical protein [Phycisphaerae bacterium]
MTRTRGDRLKRARRTARRGVAVYILVLGVATILAMTGFTLLSVARANHRIHDSLQKSLQAQCVAQAGIEKAFNYMYANPTWRQTMPNGNWFTNQAFGAGEYAVRATDSDGSLADDEGDALTLTSSGRVGDAAHKVKVTLAPRPHPALAFAAFGYYQAGVRTNAVIQGPMRSNGSMWSDGNLDPGGNAFFESLQGAYINSALTPSRYASTSMSYPQPSLSSYLSLATPVTGTTGATAKLSKYVLTPTRNSESSANVNANGIYSLDCSNRAVVIEKLRLKGTLIIHNTSQTVTFQHQLLIEPSGYSFPSILIFTNQSNVEFNLDQATFSESSDSMDYNEDGDKTDSPASSLKGIVWTDGSYITIHRSSAGVTGCIIGGGIEVHDRAVIDDDPQLAQVMIPGFIDTSMKVIPGSWREEEP